MKHPSRDERDEQNVDYKAINRELHYAMYAVFATAMPLPSSDDEPDMVAELQAAVEATGVTVRGYYDIGGFRADADLMVWMLSEDPQALQAAYHAIRRSTLGSSLEPVWSAMAMHRPAEFNKAHVPSCFAGIAARPWVTVYPFVRSYDWYTIDDAHRSKMLRDHGAAGREYPDVLANTMASFALNDYEWILAFEADELHRLTDAMRHQRGVEARHYVREETPFFTGPLVELSDWVERQPRA